MKRSNTFTHYFGYTLGNSQDPDEPHDPVQRKKDGMAGSEAHMQGKGSQGGGSAPNPQVARMKRGSGRLGSSAPKSSQKLRG